MRKALFILAFAMVLFSCQKEQNVMHTKTALKKKEVLPLPCGTDAISTRFSDLINRKNNEAQSRMSASIKLQTAGPQSTTKFVIFLDADGAIIKNTYWNWDGPFDAAPSGLTLQQLNAVKQSVQDDFSPWLVEVTFDERVYKATAPFFRTRCVITQNSDFYCGKDFICAGGVAYIGSAFWGEDVPCFVFTNGTGGDEKYTAEAVSHEIGHTLGLQHQSVWDNSCELLYQYNEGYGYGPISFTPIMGVSYYNRITNWFTGTSAWGCTDIQNDFASISAYVPMARDVEGLELNQEFEGILNYGGDKDINDVFLKGGGTTIKATSENADLKITLLHKGKKIIAANTNTSDTDAEIFVKRGGKFQLKVEAVSNENVSSRFMTGKYHIQIKQ
jgi:hypothetical protein